MPLENKLTLHAWLTETHNTLELGIPNKPLHFPLIISNHSGMFLKQKRLRL